MQKAATLSQVFGCTNYSLRCLCWKWSGNVAASNTADPLASPHPAVSSRPSVASWIHLTASAPLSFLSLIWCIIHSHVHGLSPISCLINKTYLCACSLTSPSSVLFLKPNRESTLSRWNNTDGWPLQTGRKLLHFRPSLGCVSCVSKLGKEVTVFVLFLEVLSPKLEEVSSQNTLKMYRFFLFVCVPLQRGSTEYIITTE